MSGQARFESQVVGTTLVIRISGYLNSRLGAEVGKVVDERLVSGAGNVLINFSGTRMMNSVGISSITTIVDRMADRGGRTAFCSLEGMNREIFATMGLTSRVALFDNEFEALACFESNR